MRVTAQERKLRRKQRRAEKRVWWKSHPKIRNYTLYALLLEDDNYYVGMTAYKGALRRFEQHLNGKGAEWTKVHKPVQIIETRQAGYITQSNCAKLEDAMTIEYIERYGIHRVRGGRMCAVRSASNISTFNKCSRVTIRRLEDSYVPPHIRSIMKEEW